MNTVYLRVLLALYLCLMFNQNLEAARGRIAHSLPRAIFETCTRGLAIIGALEQQVNKAPLPLKTASVTRGYLRDAKLTFKSALTQSSKGGYIQFTPTGSIQKRIEEAEHYIPLIAKDIGNSAQADFDSLSECLLHIKNASGLKPLPQTKEHKEQETPSSAVIATKGVKTSISRRPGLSAALYKEDGVIHSTSL